MTEQAKPIRRRQTLGPVHRRPVRLPIALDDGLCALADLTDRTVESLIREAVRDLLEKYDKLAKGKGR